MKKIITLIMVISFAFTYSSQGQNQANMYYSGDMDSWGATAMTYRDLGTDSWMVSIMSIDNGSSEFKFRNSNSNWDQTWSSESSVSLGVRDDFWNPNNGTNGFFVETNTKYYTFIVKDVDDNTHSEGFIMETSASPVTIDDVTQSPTSSRVSNSDNVVVTVTASASPCIEEHVYVRWSNDNFVSHSALATVTFAGVTGTATITVQSAETTITYYVFSTAISSPTSNHDLLTMYYDNNSGSNYSYTVKHGTAASTNWNVGSTWTSGNVPATDDNVIIEHSVNVASTAECNDVTIEDGATLIINENIGHTIHGSVLVYGDVWIRSKSFFDITGSMVIWPTGDLIIRAGGELTVGGATSNNGGGSFKIESSSTETGSFIQKGAIVGDVTVQRYLIQDRWHYISGQSAISGTFSSLMGLGDPATSINQFYRWDEGATYDSDIGIWVDMLHGPTGNGTDNEMGDSFVSSKGYAITYKSSDKLLSLIGVPYYINQSINIYKTPNSTGEGSNLIGNPFSSDIAINNNADETNNFIDKNAGALDDSYEAIYIWNEQAGWDGSSNADYDEITNSTASKYAPSGQAFMVIAASNGATVNFDPLIRKHGSASFYKNTNTDNTERLELFVKDSENRGNQTTIAFMDNMTLGLDPSYDAGKLKGNPNIALYTRLVEDNGIDFAIQALPNDNIESLTVPVGIDVIEATSCTFSVKPDVMEGYPIYLQDIKENTVTNLKEESYSTLVTENGAGRFFLHFTDISIINTHQLSEQLNIFSSNNNVEIRSNKPIDATINIYNIAGQLITTSQLVNESGTTVNIPNYKGVAIVSITTLGKTLNEKVIIW